MSRALASGVDQRLLPAFWHAIFLPQAMPTVFAARFPFDRVATAENLSIEGEDALAVGPALVRAAMGCASCRVPVRILGGTADCVVDNAVHGALAAGAMPTARFRWVAGAGRVLQHDAPEAVAVAVEALR